MSTRASESFVGRRVELAELHGATDEAVRGHGSLVVLAGEPGIGKTRLAEVAADHARSAGAEVHWATCWDGPAPAFWPWVQLVRAHIEAGGDAPPEVRRLVGEPSSVTDVREGDAEPVRFALFDAVATFFRTESQRVPLVLVLDDLHWADLASLRLLEFFAKDVRGNAMLVVGTFRDVEVDHETESGRALDRACAGARLFKLDGLRATEVAELLQTHSGALAPTEFTRTVHERTGGNPLFVRELARLMATTGRAETVRVPEGVIGVIERRLARLSQPCHNLLTVAAVIGNEFRIDVAAEAAGNDLQLVLKVIDEAVAARLVSVAESIGGRYVFAHALVRDALYEGIGSSRRGEMHLAVANAIERIGGTEAHLPELAHHYLQTLPAGDVARAVDHCARAGRRALEQLAYEDAVAHFRRALDALALSPDEDMRAALSLELGDAKLRAGDIPGARETFEEVADLARRRRRPDELARAALGFGAGLEGFEIRMVDQRQIELLEEAAKELGGEDSPLLSRILARLSVAVSFQESTERRRATAEDAIAMARRVGDTQALAYALAAHCDAIAGPADCELRIAEATEIVAHSRDNADRAMELLGRRLLVLAHLEVGDLVAATTEMDAFAAAAELIRQPLYSWYPALWKGTRAALEGRIDDALRWADEAEAIGARAHSQNAPMLATVLRMVVFYYWERYDELKEVVERLADMTSFSPFYVDYYMGTLYALRGELDIALPHVRRFAGGGVSALPVDAEWLPGVSTFGEALVIVGDADGAAALYELVLPHRRRFAVEGIAAGIYGSLEHYLGLLARTCGRLDDAEAHFEAALKANAPLGGPLITARTQRELARVLGERNAPPDAERAAELIASAEATRKAFGVGEAPASPPTTGSMFRREGDFWTLCFDGHVANIKDAKGLHDIGKLLAQPGREIAALDLATEIGSASPTGAGEELRAPGHAGELLDDEARAQYKARLVDLEDEITEAEDMGDAQRAERARYERDLIARELSVAYGLGGRARKAGDPAERARTAVTRRIRETITRISEVHPALGRHLRASVRTGTFCSYSPERLVGWIL